MPVENLRDLGRARGYRESIFAVIVDKSVGIILELPADFIDFVSFGAQMRAGI